MVSKSHCMWNWWNTAMTDRETDTEPQHHEGSSVGSQSVWITLHAVKKPLHVELMKHGHDRRRETDRQTDTEPQHHAGSSVVSQSDWIPVHGVKEPSRLLDNRHVELVEHGHHSSTRDRHRGIMQVTREQMSWLTHHTQTSASGQPLLWVHLAVFLSRQKWGQEPQVK